MSKDAAIRDSLVRIRPSHTFYCAVYRAGTMTVQDATWWNYREDALLMGGPRLVYLIRCRLKESKA